MVTKMREALPSPRSQRDIRLLALKASASPSLSLAVTALLLHSATHSTPPPPSPPHITLLLSSASFYGICVCLGPGFNLVGSYRSNNVSVHFAQRPSTNGCILHRPVNR